MQTARPSKKVKKNPDQQARVGFPILISSLEQVLISSDIDGKQQFDITG
jgi:hypothetical protein